MIGGPLLGIELVMTMRATLERDHVVVDDLGGRPAQDWQPLAVVPCFLWWGNGTAATRIGGPQPQPQATVDLNVGGIVMPDGTDVTARDRITQIVNRNGREVAGALEILGVAPFEGLTEISFRRLT